jgi:hypothetical protein
MVARVSATGGKSRTHGTKGGAKEHIPGGSKKMAGKVGGGRGTRHGHGGGKYKKHGG